MGEDESPPSFFVPAPVLERAFSCPEFDRAAQVLTGVKFCGSCSWKRQLSSFNVYGSCMTAATRRQILNNEWQLQKLEVASHLGCAQNLISAAIYGIIKG
jgi:hypothetical protein